ncbi:MAG TPA: hypothetical protein VMH23_08595 [Bacteroidota bacterium]|nr:hypothetical protein [Bacteroidota bacterium]
MPDEQNGASSETAAEIEIVRLNSDKTRKDDDSDAMYHVYFELSGFPPNKWRTIFEGQWQALNVARKAMVDGTFLVIHCPLAEVASTHFPALKKVVAATNEAYRNYVQKAAAELERREDVWIQERKDVDAMAAQLRFDKRKQ